MIYSLTEHKYMNINELKQKMIIPKEEYIINKEILINGKEALILSYTVEEHKKILWILYNCGTCSSGNDDIAQVNFCTRKYLDEVPDHSNIGTAFIDSCKDEKGKNGYKMRCEYADIGFDEKFEGEFQIVAFSKILKIKGSVYY